MANSRVNRFLVTVENCSEYDCSGHFFAALQDQVTHFNSFTELVLKIERQLDENRFPRQEKDIRSFVQINDFGEQTREAKNIFCEDIVHTDPKPCQVRFLINVLFRQNSSWQGSVKWLGKQRTRNFKSVLELLHFIHEALKENR